MTREKGGRHRQPFLYDVSTSMEGYAYITSSSYDEASQESDAIRSSFFTHYLISGMRGPADANLDGKVTLNEAYEFAYDETLQRTEKSKAGPQHPAYDIRLKGSGDLVFTDLRTSSSVLQLAPTISGRIFINDARGHLLVELYKNSGKKLEIGLEPGQFEVIVHTPAGVSAGKVTLNEGGVTELSENGLNDAKMLAGRLRGRTSVAGADSYAYIPLNLSLLPVVSMGGGSVKSVTNCAITLLAGNTDRLYGVELSSGISTVNEKTEGGQIAAAACVGSAVDGLQLAGVANLAHRKVNGMQIAGATNIVGRNMKGIQIGGAFNTVGNDLYGLQIASAVNYIADGARALQVCGAYNQIGGSIYGCQIAGASNVVMHRLTGSQIAGAANYVHSNARGLQISGAVNMAERDMTGCQIAGAMNIVSSDCMGLRIAGAANYADEQTGFQVAGGANINRKCTGVQIAGGCNVSDRCTGFQLAPVNICGKLTGFQLGVINICDTMTGIPLGVFSYARKIPPGYRVFLDETAFFHVGIRSGADRFYSLLSFGTSTIADDAHQWSIGAGLGARLLLPRGYLAVESMANGIHDTRFWTGESSFHLRGALIYGHQFAHRFCIWGGPSLNMGVAWKSGGGKYSFLPVTYRHRLHHWRAYWPGLVAGIEL